MTDEESKDTQISAIGNMLKSSFTRTQADADKLALYRRQGIKDVSQIKEIYRCHLCGKKDYEVKTILKGDMASICNECVDFLYELLHKE